MKKKINGRAFARDWMGRVVRVTAKVRRSFGGLAGYERVELAEPIVGWVVGFTYRRQVQWLGTDYDGHDRYSTTGPSTPVILVCPWPGRATIDAAFDGVDLADETPRGAPEWDDRQREACRSWVAQELTRDARGRWMTRTGDNLDPH